MIRTAILIALGVAFTLACLVAVTHAQDVRDTVFNGPGFILDLSRWAPYYVEDGVYLCVIEHGKWTCATIAQGSIILIPSAPADTTEAR